MISGHDSARALVNGSVRRSMASIRWSLVASLIALVILLTCASAHEFSVGGLTIVHPWARATPVSSKNGVVFLEIRAAADLRGGDRLISGRSKIAERIEIHNHVVENGVARMRRVDGVAVAAGESVVLGPTGFHVMLIGLRRPLKQDDMVALTLVFERAGEIMIEATVEPAGAMGPHGLDHQPTESSMKRGHAH